MADLARDTFDRANSDLTGSTMSDGTNTWATLDNGTMKIVSNKAGNDNTYRGNYVNSLGSVAKAHVCVKVSNVDYWGIVGRCETTSSGYNCYNVYGFYGSPGNVGLYKHVDYTRTQIGNFATYAAGDVIGLSMDGARIKVTKNGADVIDPGDQDPLNHTTGYLGLCAFPGGNPGASWADDFVVDDLAGGGGGPPKFLPEQLGLDVLKGIF